MKIASLFSGIGGFERGLQQADPTVEVVFSCDIDKYARQVYKKNFGVEPHGDITQIDAADIPDHDILCGGFPCQAFSVAGKRRGFEDTRGTLFFEIMRIAEAKRPKLLFLENVKGLLSSKTFITFENILQLLHEEIIGDTKWELQYTPLNKWTMFADNIQSYIATKWLNISESKKAQSDIYSITKSELNYENLEHYLNVGVKKRLQFLKTQISQILRKLSYYQKEQMHLSECKEEDFLLNLNQLYLNDNLNNMDICILEKTIDMCAGAGKSQAHHLAETSRQTRLFTTSMEINWMTEQTICGYVQELSIIAFIIKQWNLSTNLWKKVSSNLIEKKENMFYVGTFSIILQKLNECGYDAEWQVFNSKNHGVPQNRERVFIIGHLRGSGTRPIFPITESAEPIPQKSDGKCIYAGCLSTRNQSGQAQWDGSTTLISTAIDANYYKGIDNHGQRTAILCDCGQGRKDQLRSDIIPPLRANTGAGHNNLVVGANHQMIRRLTPTECERLQGFPDGWTEYGTKVLTTVQIHGNVWDQISVQSMGAIEKLSTVNRDYALCTINDGKSGEIQISHILPNEKTNRCVILMDVIAPHIVEKCVCDIISHGNDMVIHYNHKEMLKIKKETLKNHISESMGGNYTKPLLRIILDEKLELAKSSIILTWIKEIMKCQTFIYAKTDRPITDAIIYWSSVPQNLSEKDSLFLKMENTIKISDTQRYRCLGNAITVNVVEYISRHLLDMLHQC